MAAVSAVLLPTLFLSFTAPSGSAAPADPKVDPDTLTATQIAPTGRIEGFKSSSAALAKSSKGLVGRTDSALVPVMIKLDQDSLASYRGGIDGLAATSPAVTGSALDLTSSAARSYTSYLKKNESQAVSAIKKVAPSATVRSAQRVVYGGLAATVPANKVKDILKIDGVVAVQRDVLHKKLTDASATFLNAGPVYAKLGGKPNAGKGVIYGNLDSGVWPEHPSFADQGNLSAPPPTASGSPRECNFGDNPLTPANDPFVCQHKLIGGAHFTDSYDANQGDDIYAGTARDADGHGTHTTSTSAGNPVASAPVFGVDRGPLAGMAPGAWVMEYKVCGPAGCFSSDSSAAVAQAILDGVDVINYSISGGTDPSTDPVELAFLDAYAAGVFVAASAGNDGPGASTANHLAPWVTTVAASTQTREFASTLTLSATGGDTFTADGASITAGAGPLPVVMASAAPYSKPLCDAPAPAGSFTGKIVACERGGNGRVEKGFNVKQGGAAGMILYNPTLQDTETDNHWLPAVHLADGTAFKAFMSGHTGVTGQFTAGEKRNGKGDIMASFSSRGPAGNFIKPDVTAPGVQILAGQTPTPDSITGGPAGEYFMAIAGTSMSSPHVAGAAILMKAAHPRWTPGQIKSALMTTSITDVLKEDESTKADPFDMGAGRIDIGKSNLAPLSFDESASDYAALSADPVHAVDLNLPSINAPVLPGRLDTVRTAKNVSGKKTTFVVRTSAPGSSSITVSPSKFTLRPGKRINLKIAIKTDSPMGAQQFGKITIKPRNSKRSAMHLPVAWIHTQGSVTLSQSCADPSLPRGSKTTCDVTATNNAFETQAATLTTTVSDNLTITKANGATRVNGSLARLRNVVLAGAKPGVPSMAAGAGPAGYLPLDLFNITPEAVGDEDLLNFSVPAYTFNGKTYTDIGVDSNGYLVAGGGTAEDNNCCDLPDGADPAAPNNVMAPFWTDLNGEGVGGAPAAPGVFVGTLTDGVNGWLVVEYRVNAWGTNDRRVFQTWIGLNGVQDISYAYDPSNLPAAPAGQDLLYGAENEVGDGEMVAGAPTEDQVITSTDPAPGDSIAYSVRVRGDKRGLGSVTTRMTASGVPGTTIERDTIRVTR
jgi:subtilisin family serine protease